MLKVDPDLRQTENDSEEKPCLMRGEEVNEASSRMVEQEVQSFLEPGSLGYGEAKHPSAAYLSTASINEALADHVHDKPQAVQTRDTGYKLC